MENPNVLHFKPHPVSVKHSEAKLDCPTIREAIADHPFNHSVCLLFADTLGVPTEIKQVLTQDTTYYKVFDLPVWRLVERDFIDAFVNFGETTCMSIDTHLDNENVFALTPDGRLILSITRSEFLSLGIEQSPAVTVIGQKTENKFHVRINLKESCFVPGKRNYERVLSRLKEATNLRATVVCCWDPPNETTCPSSLPLYFQTVCEVKVSECSLLVDNRVDYNASVPGPSTPHSELFEWLALQSMGLSYDCGKVEMEYLTSYTGTENSKKYGPCGVMKCSGLISSKTLLALLDAVKSYKASKPTIPLLGLQIVGFEDAPVSWGSALHHRLTNGDNNFALVIFGSGKVVQCTNLVAPLAAK